MCQVYSKGIQIHIYGGLVAQSCPTLATPWTVARQAALSMGLPRGAFWSGWPFPHPQDEPRLLRCQVGSTAEPSSLNSVPSFYITANTFSLSTGKVGPLERIKLRVTP